MHRSNVRVIGFCFVALLSACDQSEESENLRLDELMESVEYLDPMDESWAEEPGTTELPLAPAEELPTTQTHFGSTEFFYFTANDILAITSAPGGLFPPFPADIPTLTEPELANGFLAAFKVFDQYGNIVGFGTEQEVIDAANAINLTTYTLTIPGRGTLMLRQREDLGVVFDEINDMVSSAELVRTYDPPWIVLTTVPGTGRIVGGSGEFTFAKGIMREFDVVHQINLADREFDLDVVIQVKFY